MRNPLQISISRGNIKLGDVPSVSLPPVVTCPHGVPCAAKCYAAKIARLRPSVRKAYARNLSILSESPESYHLQVRAAAVTSRFFRWHVSGDIPDLSYLLWMVETAQACPATRFLCFTKRYKLLNDYIRVYGDLPSNLQVIFSEWGDGWDVPNPYNLPTAAVVFKGTTPRDGWKICGGNCSACAACGIGCWDLKHGETIAFYEH